MPVQHADQPKAPVALKLLDFILRAVLMLFVVVTALIFGGAVIGTVLAFGSGVMEFVMQQRANNLDLDFSFNVDSPPGGFWTLLIGGLALITIASVFERGVELRELESVTI